jgi:TfoX/Sxy family transcriptional regulator of competence genes
MAKASPDVIKELEARLNRAVDGLPKLTFKKMFGCHAVFAQDAVFGLVWKEGRLGVKLPDGALFEQLMAKSGANPWKAGNMTMSHWVLVPPSMHSQGAELAKWYEKGHALALSQPKTPAKKKATKAAVKKTMAKTVKAKSSATAKKSTTTKSKKAATAKPKKAKAVTAKRTTR